MTVDHMFDPDAPIDSQDIAFIRYLLSRDISILLDKEKRLTERQRRVLKHYQALDTRLLKLKKELT